MADWTRTITGLLSLLLAVVVSGAEAKGVTMMDNCVNVNAFSGSDSEKFDAALKELHERDLRTLYVPQRQAGDGRTFWLLDRAILLDANTTMILDNATLKLSDACRDNAIRSANCGLGITLVKTLKNIHVIGIGHAEIQGADNPRSTGDSAKQLGVRSYGSDAGKEGENQFGDWRNIGILMAYVENFSVENITMRDSHCWAMSFEHCRHGRLYNLSFYSEGYRMVNGKRETNLNQDGIDLRQGCQDIVIDTIRGATGDDLIALTGLPGSKQPGEMQGTMVGGTLPTENDDICHVTIRNVVGWSKCQIVRFLNAKGVKLHHIVLDTLIDSSPEGFRTHAAVRIGDRNPAWGGVNPLGDTYGIIINNVQSKSKAAILIAGSLQDSIISNVLNFNPDCGVVTYESGTQNTKNVIVK